MKKRILILVDWYEPGYKAGGPVQSCKNFVAGMQDSFDLYVLTSDRDLGDTKRYSGIEVHKWIRKNEYVHIYYTEDKKLNTSKLAGLINQVNPDFLYLNSMYSYHFTILPLWLKRIGKIRAKIIIAPRGMLQEGAIQFKSFRKKFFIQVLNWSAIPSQLIFHATDAQEHEDILSYFPKAGNVFSIANFPKKSSDPWKSTPKQPGKLLCIFISRLAPKKNLLFLLELFQSLPENADVHLTIRGDIGDADYWKKCVATIESLPKNISVSWDGPIPNERVAELLDQNHLFILPTKGENFGHAIFEALLSGKPVLISDKTPWRNLKEKKIGWDLPLDEPPEFRKVIEQAVCFDQKQYDEWSYSAWKYARDYTEQVYPKDSYIKLFS